MEAKVKEFTLRRILNEGFGKTAQSFAQMIGHEVQYYTVVPVVQDLYVIPPVYNGNTLVITTQLISSVTGKSFLIVSEKAKEEINSRLRMKFNGVGLHDFLLELDNVISASVISHLANCLKMDVYGDVPFIQELSALTLPQYFRTEISASPSPLVFACVHFHFGDPQVYVQFLWMISSTVYDSISQEKLVM